MQYTSAIRSAIRKTDSCDRETSFEVSNSSTTVILYLFIVLQQENTLER